MAYAVACTGVEMNVERPRATLMYGNTPMDGRRATVSYSSATRKPDQVPAQAIIQLDQLEEIDDGYIELDDSDIIEFVDGIAEKGQAGRTIQLASPRSTPYSTSKGSSIDDTVSKPTQPADKKTDYDSQMVSSGFRPAYELIQNGALTVDKIDELVEAHCEKEHGIEAISAFDDSYNGAQGSMYMGFLPENKQGSEPNYNFNCMVKAILRANPKEIVKEMHYHLRASLKTDVLPQVQFIDLLHIDDEHAIPILGMELINGTSVKKYVQDRNMNERDRLALFSDVVRAVGELHKAGYVHKDIKPDNILVTEETTTSVDEDGMEVRITEPKVKIIDLGLADEIGTSVSTTGVVNFTPEYGTMQHFTGETDHTMDVCSLGMMLSEVLIGESPLQKAAEELREGAKKADSERIAKELMPKLYQTMRNEEYLAKTEDGNVTIKGSSPDVQDKISGLSRDITRLVVSSVRQDPTQRYQSCEAFAQAIDTVVSEIDSTMELYATVKETMDLCMPDGDKIFGVDPTTSAEPTTEKDKALFKHIGSLMEMAERHDEVNLGVPNTRKLFQKKG